MTTSPGNIVECFLSDPSFVDLSKAINPSFSNVAGKIGSLSPKAMSYFTNPSVYKDKRDPTSRAINWSGESAPSIIVDGSIFSGFVNSINALTTPISAGLFRMIDILFFAYDANNSKSTIEQKLLLNADIASIYVPNSFELSMTVIQAQVHYLTGNTSTVSVPAYAKFSINIPTGSTTTTYVITMFTSVDAFIAGYDYSTIVDIIPPLPYSQIYTASLTNAVDNVFVTAQTSATYAYNSVKAVLGDVSVSGMTEYNAVITDAAKNTAAIPFNIIYKGRSPTLNEIRAALRQELANSGVGDAAGWEAKIPGIYVAGRFYIVPFWDKYIQKPDQKLFPSILDYNEIGTKLNRILESTGFGDVRQYANVLEAYYNKMTAAAVPDLTGLVDIKPLKSVIPDYQSYSQSEDNFAYMSPAAQAFSAQLNTVLAIDTGTLPPGVYAPITENLLTFYSFVVEKYEVCVITKQCYQTIMESSQ